MKIVIIIISLVLILLAVFTAANWMVLTTPTPLSFVAFSIEGPLGIILLGVALSLTLLVVAYALLLRTSWLVESRRLNRQLEQQRELAQQAETSRIVALQELIEHEFEEIQSSIKVSGEAGIARIDTGEKNLTKTIEDVANSIIANIGYLDDRIKDGPPSPETDMGTDS